MLIYVDARTIFHIYLQRHAGAKGAGPERPERCDYERSHMSEKEITTSEARLPTRIQMSINKN